MDDFDCGAEVVGKGPCYKRWPEEGELTALLDGDMLPYVVGYTTEETQAAVAVLATMKELGISKDVGFDPKAVWWYEELLKQPAFQNACDHVDFLVNDWTGLAEADSAIVFMSGSTNFRDHVAFSRKYKGTRKDEKPPFFYELRTHLLEKHGGRLSDCCEADDDLAIEQTRSLRALGLPLSAAGSEQHKAFADTCIVSKDKDLNMVPGWHADPNTSKKVWVDYLGELEPVWKDKEVTAYEYWPLCDGKPMDPEELAGLGIEADTWARGAKKGQVKEKRVVVGTKTTQYIDKLRGTGMKFFYAQLIMGDTVDNYTGIPAVGKTAAFNALHSCTTERECFRTVFDLYLEKYGAIYVAKNYRGGRLELSAYQMMLEQGRLAWMQTEKGEVWRQEMYLPDGEEDTWQ